MRNSQFLDVLLNMVYCTTVILGIKRKDFKIARHNDACSWASGHQNASRNLM